MNHISAERNTTTELGSIKDHVNFDEPAPVEKILALGEENISVIRDSINPQFTFASPWNMRAQDFTLVSPKVRSIYESIRTDGQQHEATARVVDLEDPECLASLERLAFIDQDLANKIRAGVDTGQTWYEIGEGSTRRKCIAWLDEAKVDSKEWHLDVWIGDFTNEQLKRKAKLENEQRRGHAAYDEYQNLLLEAAVLGRAVDAQGNLPKGTVPLLVKVVESSETQIRRILNYGKIPDPILNMLVAKDMLPFNAIDELYQLCKAADDSDIKRTCRGKKAKFDNATDFMAHVRKNLQGKVVEDKRTKKKTGTKPPSELKLYTPQVYTFNGKKKFSANRHRTKGDQYKIDLFDVSADVYKQVVEEVAKITGATKKT